MENLVLIQARVGSSRLPNKVLRRFGDKSDLQWVIERVQRSVNIDEVMVVTSIERDNLPIVKLCTELGIRVFVGSENDVLDRFYQASKLIRPRNIIRVTADCPMFDWRYLDQALVSFENDADYLWMGDDSFPDGLDLEIMRFDALKKAWKEAKLPSEREHVTLYFRNHPEIFNIQLFDFPIKGISNYRWTLDEEKDYEMISHIYEYFISVNKVDFVTEDILAFLGKYPDIAKINSCYTRNEGLVKSLTNDRVLSNGKI